MQTTVYPWFPVNLAGTSHARQGGKNEAVVRLSEPPPKGRPAWSLERSDQRLTKIMYQIKTTLAKWEASSNSALQWHFLSKASESRWNYHGLP